MATLIAYLKQSTNWTLKFFLGTSIYIMKYGTNPSQKTLLEDAKRLWQYQFKDRGHKQYCFDKLANPFIWLRLFANYLRFIAHRPTNWLGDYWKEEITPNTTSFKTVIGKIVGFSLKAITELLFAIIIIPINFLANNFHPISFIIGGIANTVWFIGANINFLINYKKGFSQPPVFTNREFTEGWLRPPADSRHFTMAGILSTSFVFYAAARIISWIGDKLSQLILSTGSIISHLNDWLEPKHHQDNPSKGFDSNPIEFTKLPTVDPEKEKNGKSTADSNDEQYNPSHHCCSMQ